MTSRSTIHCFVQSIVVITVVACLCFSVGEGLRLTGFPVSDLAKSTVPAHHPASISSDISSLKYGPLDVPTRIQNRGKRQGIDHGFPPAGSKHQLTLQRVVVAHTTP